MFKQLSKMVMVGACLALPALAQDFSEGLTGLGAAPALAPTDAARAAAQRAVEEAAAAALAAAPAQTRAEPGALQPGDQVRLTVFGEQELSGEFEIDNTGSLAVPLLGEVPAQGRTARELEKMITDRLAEGYLVNPRVNLEVLNFRPFFILGEVNNPGSYPWDSGMTVINAVALGGGYTPRARTGEVVVRRANDPSREEVALPEDAEVYPGDVIRVRERFF